MRNLKITTYELSKICGFDNISILDKYKIPVTSVSYQTSEIAAHAVDIILNKKKKDIIIDYTFVKRN